MGRLARIEPTWGGAPTLLEGRGRRGRRRSRDGFYSRGFASFAGKGGFAANLGRFGETTLPFFLLGADGAAPSSCFSILGQMFFGVP